MLVKSTQGGGGEVFQGVPSKQFIRKHEQDDDYEDNNNNVGALNAYDTKYCSVEDVTGVSSNIGLRSNIKRWNSGR